MANLSPPKTFWCTMHHVEYRSGDRTSCPCATGPIINPPSVRAYCARHRYVIPPNEMCAPCLAETAKGRVPVGRTFSVDPRVRIGVPASQADGHADDNPIRTPSHLPMRPRIVVLCGSTRFKDEFIRQNARLTGEGKIVLSVGFFAHADHEPYCASLIQAEPILHEPYCKGVEPCDCLAYRNGTDHTSRNKPRIDGLSVGYCCTSDEGRPRRVSGACNCPKAVKAVTPAIKARLDELHLRKIDIADEVFVINVGGYEGSSTLNEVAYAVSQGKPVAWLEPRSIAEARTMIGSQVAPTPNQYQPIWERVVADMGARDQHGLAKYGTRLQPFNGRDALRDAYEEALDLVVYLKQAIVERDAARDAKVEVRIGDRKLGEV